MSDTVNRLLERRAQLVNQMREVAERGVNENREMSAEEDAQFTAMNAEVDALQKRADAMIEGEQRAKDTEESYARLSGRPQERQDPKQERGDTELREWMRGKGGRDFTVANESFEARADQTTSNASGVIPSGFRDRLWEYMIETAGILSAGVDLMNTNGGETIKLPRATAHSAAGSTTEGSSISASDPTLSSVNSTVTKEGYTVQLSRELLDDSGVDLTGYLAKSAGRALGNAVGAAAATAAIAAATAGVTAGNGLSAVTGFGVQSTAGSGFDFLISLFYSVIDPYRRSSSCSWLMADPTAAAVRKLKSADGVYAWQPAVTAGQPDLILGKPVYIDTNVADPAAGAKSILFGDWSSLVVRIAGGYRFERSDEFAFDADLVTYRALVRHGSVSVDANALKSFVHAAS